MRVSIPFFFLATARNILIVLVMLFVSSCEDSGPTDIESNVETFNLDLFEQNLIDNVNWGGDSPVGWAYAITQNGQLVRSNGFGNAVQEPDGQTVAMTDTKEINIASVTKFYTAIVVMQLLDDLDLSMHDVIEPYLPDSWNPGPNIDGMTFAHLMRHESGLFTGDTDFNNTLSYTAIQQEIEDGLPVAPPFQYDYDNINFAIFRILIPSLRNQLPNAPLTSLDSDVATQASYREYMQIALFDKVGMPNVDFSEEPNNPTRYYHVNDVVNGRSGTQYGDWDHISGGGGYYMNVIEMAAVNAFFQHSEVLVSEETRNVIQDNYMGLDAYFNGDPRELYGNYYGKGGSIRNSSDLSQTQGVLTQIQMFPSEGVEVAVVVNTRQVTYRTGVNGLKASIKQAFNTAFE
jgi:D-alanyl-D-alanine carboxypeptidase